MQSGLILLITNQFGTQHWRRGWTTTKETILKPSTVMVTETRWVSDWKRWLIMFELLAGSKGQILNEENANNRQRRRALLLHLAGTDVQDIFYTLPDMGDEKDYEKAVDALNAYFVPKIDATYARHCFRQLTEAPGETIRQFATRLRRAAKDCGYGADTDNQICDEILCKCTSTYISENSQKKVKVLT